MTPTVNIGHSGLVGAIAREIAASGPLTFARFMELALYHEPFGYYMRRPEDESAGSAEPPCEDRIGPDRVCEDRIGWNGDFYTSSDVHPVMGQALARQAHQVDERLGHPDPFTVLEMGAGKGFLARDFLAAAEGLPGSFFERLRYTIIERSPAMRASQERQLARWTQGRSRTAWLAGLDELADGSLVGLLLSNELVDAFPVHRVTMERGQPRELYVAWEDGRFVEQTGPLSTDALQRYLQRLASIDVALADGMTTEINLQALDWMREVGRVLGRGLVLTIDYGHTAQDYYGAGRRRGTLLCYYHQMASEDPYVRVGLQDMTAHVDFSSLATAGEEAGLQVTGFTNQLSFLMGLGVEQILDRMEPGSKDFQSVVHLLRPDGMGRTFKILAQHKGMAAPALDGLQFKPFFGSALALRGREQASTVNR